MENISDFFGLLLDSEKLIHYGGLTLLLILIIADSGTFLGLFLPGDSLLFSAGLLCGTQDLDVNIFALLLSVTIAAIIGNLTGYATGNLMGKNLFKKEDSLFFKQKHLEMARGYFQKYGGAVLIAGRFFPVVRPLIPMLAGAIKINFWKFNLFNITGSILWACSFISLGYFLGKHIPGIDNYLPYSIIGIMIITFAILIRGYLKLKKHPEKSLNPKP